MEKKAWHEPSLKRLDVLLTEGRSDPGEKGQGNQNNKGDGGKGKHKGWDCS